MTEQIDESFKQGIVSQAFQAERNILIWQYIATESEFLSKQGKYVKSLYLYLQQSAQTNFVLSIGKLFDKPDKKFPTRCILSFLELVESTSSNAVEIIETTGTISLLKKYNCPKDLITAVTAKDKSTFPKLFAEYYRNRYNSEDLKRISKS